MARFKNIAGEKVGRLEVVRPTARRGKKNGSVYWYCRCDCGNETVVRQDNLTNHLTRSCGCVRVEASARTGRASRIHGESGAPLYAKWKGMRQRCYNANHKKYHRYGGRGITVCPEWHDYETFRDWALANGWHEGLELDRIFPERDYCPENCQFLTKGDHSRKTWEDRRNYATAA